MVEYNVIPKGDLGRVEGRKVRIEDMLPGLGAQGFMFAFETDVSYVFWRPQTEQPPEQKPKPRAVKPKA